VSRTRAALACTLALLASPAFASSGTDGAGSYLGVHAQSNSNVLDAENVEQGITVTSVVENSPAAGAGLLPGDVLLEANGVALGHPDTLDDLVETLAPGSPVKLRLERARRALELEARTVARIAVPAPPVEAAPPTDADTGTLLERRRLGFAFRSAPPELLESLGLSRRFGVEVQRVAERSPLREAGVEPGDLLLEIDGEPIPSSAELLGFLDRQRSARRVKLAVFERDQGRREVDVALHQPEFRARKLSIPLLFSFDRKPEVSEYSALAGLVKWTRLENGTRFRLFYLFSFETGSDDELIDVGGEGS
jgi:S1-C subfamily serine protease